MTHIEEARVIAFAAAGQVNNNEDAKCVETLVEKLVYVALAAAEERGRIDALDEAATRIDRQWRANGAMNCTEICAIVRAVALTKDPTP